jgi:hypothetical protein
MSPAAWASRVGGGTRSAAAAAAGGGGVPRAASRHAAALVGLTPAPKIAAACG